MANAGNFLIAGNDEHGVNPPTPYKRTPIMPYINRSFYENEYNAPTKRSFLSTCALCGFKVYDVKPEDQDITITERIIRINRANPTLAMIFAYNAYGDGVNFNSVNGYINFYSSLSRQAMQSEDLTYAVNKALPSYISTRNGGVTMLTGISLLEKVNCPSSLLEGGFMTNFNEAKLMVDPDFQYFSACGVANGVCNFLQVPYVQKKSYTELPTLKKGDRGDYVRYLQCLLIECGYDQTADGVFGAGTEGQLQAFQQFNGLVADGVAGPKTWQVLLRDYSPYPVLKEGSQGEIVKYMQYKLLSKLYPVGAVDGKFGSNVRNQVIAFQRENGLVADGIVGAATWAKLRVIGGGRSQP